MRLDFLGGKAVLSSKKMYFGNAYHTDGMYEISTTVYTLVINEMFTLCTLLPYGTTD